jgi:hypothetical protein
MTTIVIMPGGFHPYHAGHHALYQSAQRAFPDAEVYVAATNDTSSRPFPFAVKEKLARLAGVETGHFVQVKSPFRAEEITAKFDPQKDVLIFVRSEKDANTPPQPGGVKRDGSPSYLQPLLGAKRLEPFAKHAYMAYLPTVEFGPGMTSATQIRSAWPGLDERRKTALVMSLYPRTQTSPQLAQTVVKLLDAAIGGEQGVAEGYSNTTFQTERRRLNVPALIKAGALFVTYPHGEQGWETDNQEDWAYSLISLYNVMQGGWPGEAKKYLKPASYKKAEQQVNSSAPNLGSDKLVYDGKYNQILWSIKKLGIPDNIAFLDDSQQGVAEASKRKQVPKELDRDPQLRQAMLYAKQHYPQHANDPEMALMKWLQRGLNHSEQEDRQHDRRIAQLTSKVASITSAINQLKQQQVTAENNDYLDE